MASDGFPSIMNEEKFLSFLITNSNYKQVAIILKNVDDKQYRALQEIVINILTAVIPVSKEVTDRLYTHRAKLRKLSLGTLPRSQLGSLSPILLECVRLGLQHHEICGQNGHVASGGVSKPETKSSSKRKLSANNESDGGRRGEAAEVPTIKKSKKASSQEEKASDQQAVDSEYEEDSSSGSDVDSEISVEEEEDTEEGSDKDE